MFIGRGYFERPKKEARFKIGKLKVVCVRYADLLNGDDHDVSFAYTFSGSRSCSLDGKHDPAKETAERGRQKAQFSPLPDKLEPPEIVSKWSRCLSDLNGELCVYVGESDHRGLLYKGLLRIDCDMTGFDLSYGKDGLTLRERCGFDLKIDAWIRQTEKKICQAKKLKEKMESLSISVDEDY